MSEIWRLLLLFLCITQLYIQAVSYRFGNAYLYKGGRSCSNSNKNLGGGPPRPPNTLCFMCEISPENDSAKGSAEVSISEDVELSSSPFKRKWMSLSEEARDDIKTTLISFAFALFVRVVMFEPRYIPSLSMFPTFDIGDQLIVDKISKTARPYQKRDVVVFNPTDTYIDLTGNTEALIKRIVATAGDTVEVKNNHLYVNDVLQEENYVNELPDYNLPAVTVPAGCVLVLGDNRNHSFDSHIWGFLEERNIVGRAVVKYWPPWRIG